MRKDVGVKTVEIDINKTFFLRYTPISKDLPVNVSDHLFGKAHVIAYILYLHSSVSLILISLILRSLQIKEKRN